MYRYTSPGTAQLERAVCDIENVIRINRKIKGL